MYKAMFRCLMQGSLLDLPNSGYPEKKNGTSCLLQVGSAAFNLLCITAVCVSAIPDGEVRRIKDMQAGWGGNWGTTCLQFCPARNMSSSVL